MRNSFTAVLTVVLFALLVGTDPTGSAASSGPLRLCLDTKVKVEAGKSTRIKLDCRRKVGGRVVRAVTGSKGVASRAFTRRPAKGNLSGFRARAGLVTYKAKPSAKGQDRIRFQVRLKDGRRFTSLVLIQITAKKPTPDPDPDPEPTPEIPAPLPAGTPAAITFEVNNWKPRTADTCSQELHERFVVIGPDGRKYPTWHPPVVTDPTTGEPCTFGHEHGRDPRGSDVFDWVAEHFSAPGLEQYAGLPFGVASQALEDWPEEGGMVRREDNPGYKVDFRNDVQLFARNGAGLNVTCDYLVRYHQGSHSADATSNNIHETMFAYKCDDGTELISNAFTSFGNAGEYTRSCDESVTVKTTDNGYPDGSGGRFIPDRTCMNTHFLVAPGRTTSAFTLWERWIGDNSLHTGNDPATGQTLASFYTRFDVFDPARYADPDPEVTPTPGYNTRIGRPLDLCWEEGVGGYRVDRNFAPCVAATDKWSIPAEERPAYDTPASPFSGSQREVRLRGATVSNEDGPTAWYTDPFGGNASTAPFPGAICQLVSPTENGSQPELQERTFRSPDATGQAVHPPN